MTNLFGTEIFWITLIVISVILSLATLIGRVWCRLFPDHFQSNANFYLAPALGLATLTLIASALGRIMPLGKLHIAMGISIALFFLAFINEKKIYQSFRHAITISAFGIVCGVSLLVPLFIYGAFNSHNDTFTYLAHSNWLQEHAFRETISADAVTPLTTQISLYQSLGLRMGGSFLLAFAQALFNLRWSYEVYPAVIVVFLAACCLAIGFPIAQTFRSIKRYVLLALLALPAFSLGGLVFGANLGFLPQTAGLAFGTSFLAATGFLLHWIIVEKPTSLLIGKSAIPCAILFAGATLVYSEIIPFFLLASFAAGIFLAVRFRAWKRIFIFGGLFSGFSILLLNTELVRAYAAIKMQSGAVAGTPVAWPLLGFIAHAFGTHGGAWDILQWTSMANISLWSFIFGLFLLGLLVGAIVFGLRSLWRSTASGELLPIIVLLVIFVFAFIYFRYFVPSPFSTGTGQSWSQFKLADWANPFLMVVVLFSFAALHSRLGSKLFNILIIGMFAVCMISTIFFGRDRIQPFIQYYGRTNDLDKFYIDFRNKIISACPHDMPIYLDLSGPDVKFRQTVLLYLSDREVESDWTDDGYIYPHLPLERQKQELKGGSCIVESIKKDGWLEHGDAIGPFQVGYNYKQIKISSITGAYESETDEKNQWNWVEHKISYELQSLSVAKKTVQTKIHFEYETRGSQSLTLNIVGNNGINLDFALQSKGDMPEIFEKIIDLSPSQLSEIVIETNGSASRLSENDPRTAAFVIRNMRIQ